MGALKLDVDAKRPGLKGTVLGAFDRLTKRREHQKEMNKVFMEPKCENFDQLADEWAERYWNKFSQSEQKTEKENIAAEILRAVRYSESVDSALIKIDSPVMKTEYAKTCSYIQTARELGCQTDIPWKGWEYCHYDGNEYMKMYIPIIGTTNVQ